MPRPALPCLRGLAKVRKPIASRNGRLSNGGGSGGSFAFSASRRAVGEVPLVLVGLATGWAVGAELHGSVGPEAGGELLQGPDRLAAAALAVAKVVEGRVVGHGHLPSGGARNLSRGCDRLRRGEDRLRKRDESTGAFSDAEW